MHRHILKICTLTLLFISTTSIANAQSPRFFSELPDIPLMDNMIELTDQNLVFDKAHGRLIESRAIIDSKTEQDIKRYYAGSLNSFGWSQTSPTEYQRGKDTIKLSFEPLQESTILTITLTSSLP